MPVMDPTHDDMPRQIGDLMRLGTIEAVEGSRATVRLGDVVTPPCPWFSFAGLFRLWCPPSPGEQVLLLCPEADIGHGLILAGIFSDAFPAPTEGVKLLLQMPDGTTLSYDPATQVLAITLAGGSVEIAAPAGVSLIADMDITGNVTITGDLSISGNAHVAGTITGDTDVIAAGHSGKLHRHGLVRSGTDISGPPS